MALLGEPRFELRRAVAFAARPWVGAVEIAASAARVCVLHSFEREEPLPILALLGQRSGAVADLDPLNAAIAHLSSLGHVAKVLVARDRTCAKRPVVDRARECVSASWLHTCRDEISHGLIVRRGIAVAPF